MTESAVTLRNVAKNFPNGTQALRTTDLAITRGSFVSLVGPSGCGKSTLLRLIAGLLPPTSGAITRTDGRLGFVFQESTLMPWATARDNVALPLRLENQAIEPAASDALGRLGLAEFANAYPHELSGGMQMRVSIARAIVTAPALLLLDEPFAALDEFTRFRLNDDLRALWQKHGWTIVFVTHSVQEAVFLSERVVVMSPRPGGVVADLTIDLPQERDVDFRLSGAFVQQCARISAAMSAAMKVPA